MLSPGKDQEILILGGGPAGLATGWAFEKLGRAYRILEAAPVHGGNARTITFDEFRYDTGPHRFHDRGIRWQPNVLSRF